MRTGIERPRSRAQQMPRPRLGKGSLGIWNKKEQSVCANSRAGRARETARRAVETSQ